MKEDSGEEKEGKGEECERFVNGLSMLGDAASSEVRPPYANPLYRMS